MKYLPIRAIRGSNPVKVGPPSPKKVLRIKDFAFPMAWALLHIR
jgi:hypothetical protein